MEQGVIDGFRARAALYRQLNSYDRVDLHLDIARSLSAELLSNEQVNELYDSYISPVQKEEQMSKKAFFGEDLEIEVIHDGTR